MFVNARKKQRARLLNRIDTAIRERLALTIELGIAPGSTDDQIASAVLAKAAQISASDDAWQAADAASKLAARESSVGAVVEMHSGDLRFYRTAAHAPQAHIMTAAHLEAAIRRSRSARIFGVHGTSSPTSPGMIRTLSAPLFS